MFTPMYFSKHYAYTKYMFHITCYNLLSCLTCYKARVKKNSKCEKILSTKNTKNQKHTNIIAFTYMMVFGLTPNSKKILTIFHKVPPNLHSHCKSKGHQEA